MKRIIPIFPLQIVVYPEELVNLHIFEPRYRELIKDCQENDISFGIPAFIDEKLMRIGTEIRLIKIHKVYPDGRLDITVEGVGPFSIEEVFETLEGKLYSGARIQSIEHFHDQEMEVQHKLHELVIDLFETLDIQKEIPDNNSITSFSVGHFIGLSLNQEFELLSIPSERERSLYLINHIQQVIPIAKKMKAIRDRAQMNGAFRELGGLDLSKYK